MALARDIHLGRLLGAGHHEMQILSRGSDGGVGVQHEIARFLLMDAAQKEDELLASRLQ
jgi:hypothetical protein